MKHLRNSCLALFISLFAIWLIGIFTLSSPSIGEYNPQLGFVVSQNGSFKQERQENWTTTRFGAWGLEIHDAEKLEKHNARGAILGDSYVEANMIAWPDRIQNIAGDDVIGIGFSGTGLDNYPILLNAYKQRFPELQRWAILIGDATDLIPQNGDLTHQTYREESKNFDKISQAFRLYAFRNMARKLKSLKLDFVGNQTNKTNKAKTEDTAYSMTWDSHWRIILRQLKELSKSNIVIIYAPLTPALRNGKIDMTDPNEILFSHFARICKEEGITFINLGPEFNREFIKSRHFVRGFFNTPLSEGHLNRRGHRIAGEKLKQYWNSL